jgi:uncharacterized sulfatase
MYDNKVPEPKEPAMKDIPPVALQTELSGFAQPKSRVGAIAGYYACISFMDENLGLLLDEMDRGKLWEKTVVVLLGDNGWHLGDHGGLWSKLSMFENATRVPMIMAGVGVPVGKVLKEPVELLDIYPTLAELCGLIPPPGLEGKSLVPWMNGQVPAGARAFSMVYHYDVKKEIDVLGRTVKTSSFRYTDWLSGEREMYMGGGAETEYVNEVESGNYTEQRAEGERLVRELRKPKPGAANRPRALVKDK